MTDNMKPVCCGCGGEAVLCESDKYDSFDFTYMIYCKACGISSDVYDTESEAIEAWNRAMGAKDINVPDKFATDTNVGNEIIYCKDCKYSHMTIDGLCKYCDIWFPNEEMYADGKHFCASAEKRML